MLHKTKQRKNRFQFTTSNRLPARAARNYLINEIRDSREVRATPASRAVSGFLRWRLVRAIFNEDRISYRRDCFITGRARGLSRRFSISRTCVKHFSDKGLLFGLRKASW